MERLWATWSDDERRKTAILVMQFADAAAADGLTVIEDNLRRCAEWLRAGD